MRNNKGMTMIELLGVITLLGIILVVAVPNVYKYATGARNQSYDTMAKSLYEAAEAKFMDDGAILDVCVDRQIDVDIRRDRELMQKEFAKPLGTNLRRSYITCDGGTILYSADQDLVPDGYIDPLVSPGRGGQPCGAWVEIMKYAGYDSDSSGVNSAEEYFYRVYIKCPSKEFTKVFTTTAADGEDADE